MNKLMGKNLKLMGQLSNCGVFQENRCSFGHIFCWRLLKLLLEAFAKIAGIFKANLISYFGYSDLLLLK